MSSSPLEAVKQRPAKRGHDGVSKKEEGDGGASTAKSAGNGPEVGASKIRDPGPIQPPPQGDTKAVTKQSVPFSVTLASPQPAPSLTTSASVAVAVAVAASGSINNPPAPASTTAPATVMTVATTTTTGNNNNNVMLSLASQLKSLSTAAASSCWGATTSGCETIQSTLTSPVPGIPPNIANVVVHQPQPTSILGASGNPTVTGAEPGPDNRPPKPTIATPNSSGVNAAGNLTPFSKEPFSLPPLPQKSPASPQIPSWRGRCSQVYKSGSPYKTFPVLPNSSEYSTIVSLLSTLNVTSVEQVVNPDLWARYINARRGMLISKTDDVTLLKQLGLDDMGIARCQLLSTGFSKSFQLPLKEEPFSTNEALLFHCTRKNKTLERILLQGLDERLSTSRCILGSGIYFSDDFNKCLKYDGTGGNILVCLVLLGDCLAVDNHPDRASFIRGPDKDPGMKVTLRDISFHSITARPTGPNEFVIFNRNQCCPLYLVKYSGKLDAQSGNVGSASASAGVNVDNYERARKSTPDLVWKYNGYETPLPPNGMDKESWPFYAHSLLKMMGFAEGDSPIDMESGASPSWLAKTSANASTAVSSASKELKPGIHLASVNAPINKTTVGQPKLLAFRTREEFKPKPHFPYEDCTICYTKYPALSRSPSNWVMLQCSHRICKDCHKKMETTGRTMSGKKHTFMKCPFCNQNSGTRVGDCPNGKMTVRHLPQACTGYPAHGTIQIHYKIDSILKGYMLDRTAYLPETEEGKAVLELLKIAWDRRLCFVFGTSITTGEKNVLVWNIHHKTSRTGGPSCYGYPDPDYLQRVKWELKAFGIE